jgi:hypothetical protein
MRDPPTSGVPWRTPGDSTPIDMTLRETGSVSMMSRVSTCVRDADCTSTCGVSPETVIVSSSAPTFMSALIVMTTSDGTSTASRTTVLKPVSENVTLYVPGRSASIR